MMLFIHELVDSSFATLKAVIDVLVVQGSLFQDCHPKAPI